MLTELAKLIQTYNFKSKEEIEKCMREFDLKDGTFLKNFALNPTILPDIRYSSYNGSYNIPLTFLIENPSFDLWFLEGILSPIFFYDYMKYHNYTIAHFQDRHPEVINTDREFYLYKIYINECNLFAKCFIPENRNSDSDEDGEEFLTEIEYYDHNGDTEEAYFEWINPKTMEKIDISELNFDYVKFIKLLREEVAKGKTENV